MMIGGDKRDRTADLLRARQALSQLSYIPNQRTEYRCQMTDCFFLYSHPSIHFRPQITTLNDILSSALCPLLSESGGSEWT